MKKNLHDSLFNPNSIKLKAKSADISIGINRKSILLLVFMLSILLIDTAKAQTQLAAPMTLTYASTSTLPPCGSNGTAVNTTTESGRAAAMNDGGFVITIPAASTNYANYSTKCLYWGFWTGATGGIGGFNTANASCGTGVTNFSTPSISGATLTVTGTTTLNYYNAGATASTTMNVRMRVVLSAGSWGQYSTNYYMAGPLNASITATVFVEAQYPFTTIAASVASTNPILCGTHQAFTNGSWYPALKVYDQVNTNTGFTACTSFVPWFYTFDKPTMSALTNTICTGAGSGITLNASPTSAYTWTVAQSNVSGATAQGTQVTSTSLNQTLTATTTAPGTATYTVTPFSAINAANQGTCQSASTQTATVTVNPRPTSLTGTPSNPTICTGTGPNIALTTNTTGGTNSFAWAIANNAPAAGATASSGSTINQTLTNAGTTFGTSVYTITPTFTNNSVPCASLSTFTQTVTVNPAPTVTVTSPNPFICTGSSFSMGLSNNTTTAGPATNTWSWTGTNNSPTTGASGGTGTPISQTLTNLSAANSTATYVITPTYTYNSVACNGSTSSQTVTVYPQPAKPTVNGSTVNFPITFCGTGNLIAIVGTNGNTARFYTTYPGSPVASGLSYTVSTAGTYYVTSYNTTTLCESAPIIVTVSITPPFTISNTLSNYNGYNVSCNGGTNGTITTTATSTAYPITYTWSTGKTTTINSGTVTDNITGLAAGTYTVFITDNAGCGNNATLTITQPPALSLSLVPSNFSGYGTNCNGNNNGSITNTPSGGTGAYTYAWTSTPSGFTSASGNISALTAKTYTVTVTDANSCTILGSSVITDPAVITFTYSVGYACSGSTYTSAAVTITAAGGASGNYEYKMDAGAWQSSNVFSGLTNGSSHTFQVRDLTYTSCLSGTQTFTITFPANGVAVGDCNFIYVSTGGDATGTLGSKACPVTLLQAFVIYAGNSSRNHILIESGTYGFNSTITVPAGVVIDGGYNSTTWIKSTNTATILNVTPVLVANALEGHYTGIILNGNNITLQDLTINVLTAGAPVGVYTANRGRSVYGIYSSTNTGFLISRCNISTGAASVGLSGAALTGSGGAGAGGAGGNNGNSYISGCDRTYGTSGATGSAGSGGAAGGGGGAGCQNNGCNWYGCDASGCNAAGGNNGSAGAAGTNGAAAAANTTGIGAFFVPVDGNNGTNGAGGGGGGRGGEGASGSCCTCTCGPFWGTGGVGGNGGNGGLGGNKGYGGGGSFGIYASGGSGTVTDCNITPGSAGGAGTGSNGQPASAATSGSLGGDNSGYCDGGKGGRGGDGGAGGAGGNGTNGAAGISATIQPASGATIGGSGTSVPNNGTVTADWKRGCTKSQIDLTKTSGSGWAAISSDPAYVLDKDSASTSYTSGSSPISISYTTTGLKNLTVGSTVLSNFIRIYGVRLVDPATAVMSAISPNIICPTASITLGNTLTGPQLANITDFSWEISLVSNPFTNVYTSTAASPGTVAAPVGGWQVGGLYQVRLEMKELCCGWSIPIYRTFRIYPALAQPTITAVPSTTACAGSTIRYSTTVAGASAYTWTVTGGTYVNVSLGVIDVTWPTATAGSVSVVPQDACTPYTDGPARTITVNVNANPTVSVTNSVPIICLPGNSLLTANPGSGAGAGTGSFTYIWSPGSTTAQTLTVTPGAAGSYPYTVQVTENGSGCKVTSSVTTVDAKAALSASSAAATLASCQLNSTNPYADLSATAPGAGTSGTWTITGGPGTVTTPTSNNTQITGLSNSGTSTTLNWSVGYTTAPACTATSSTITLTPLNLASTLDSVSRQNSGAAVSTRPDYYSCKTCNVKDGKTYVYYDNVGRIIAKIQDLAAPTTELGNTEVCVGYDYNPPASVNAGNVKYVNTNLGDQQPYLPRSWTIKPTTTPNDVIVTLYFTNAEYLALQVKANGGRYQFSGYDLAITKYPGGVGSGSFLQPAPATPTGVNVPCVFSAYNNNHQVTFAINSFSTFYIHPQFYPFAPLPVELTSFTGWNESAINKLNWKTASEKNTVKFEVQKSFESANWFTIGEKPASGNSTIERNYDFDDNNPVIGNNYYRLKIIDMDGTFSYSNVINIPINDAIINSFVKVYPNPTSGILNVDIQSTSSYEIKMITYDVVGKKVFDKTMNVSKGLNSFSIDYSLLAKGSYVLQYSDKDGVLHSAKFIKD